MSRDLPFGRFDDNGLERTINKDVSGGYPGLDSATGLVAISKLGTLGSSGGFRALHDDGKFKAAVGQKSVVFWCRGDAAVTLTNLNLVVANSLTPANGVTINVRQIDLTGYAECRLIAHRNSGTCANGTTAELRYFTALSATDSDYIQIGTSAVSVLVDNTVAARPFVATSSWIGLAAGAKADIFVTPIFSGGDGVQDPTFGYVEAQFR